VELKDELKNTSIQITCLDEEGNVLKRVTSTDDGDVEDNENPGSSTDNQGGTDNQSQGGGTDSGDENLGDGD
jgi:hypothetical protein